MANHIAVRSAIRCTVSNTLEITRTYIRATTPPMMSVGHEFVGMQGGSGFYFILQDRLGLMMMMLREELESICITQHTNPYK